MYWTAVCLYLLVNVLFVLKYSLRVGTDVAVLALILYLLYIGGLLLLLKYTSKKVNKYSLWVVFGVLMGTLIVLQYAINPYTLRVDRWSAIHNFLANLFHGDYPYAAHTHLGGYGSPFPVWQLAHIPFYLIGNVGLSLFLMAGLFIHSVSKLFDYGTAYKSLILLAFSPAFIYEAAVRSDLMGNFLLCLAVISYMECYKVSLRYHWIAWAVVCGLMLSSRVAVAIPLFLYLFRQYIRLPFSKKCLFPLLSITVFLITFLPFVLYGWDTFQSYNPFRLQTSQLLPIDYVCLTLLIIGVAWAMRGDYISFLGTTGITLWGIVTIIFLRNMWLGNSFDQIFESAYDISYFNMSLPFIIMYLAKGRCLQYS